MSHAALNVIEIKRWKDFKAMISEDKYRSWAFRGQANAEWSINSKLSRYLTDFNVNKEAWEFQEERILRIFKRKAHLFLNHIPPDDDDFQWLALMQHHGTPTRLIDFTWSPYVAAFFALEQATTNAAIWAVFPPNINYSPEQRIRAGSVIDAPSRWIGTPGNYKKYFLPSTSAFAVIGEPEIMNQRLIAHAGTFVVPGKIDEPLETILLDFECDQDIVLKIELDTASIRKEAMRDLYYSNITQATLFPGIDGMARSLAYELEFHWAFDPDSMKILKGFEHPPEGLPNTNPKEKQQ
jgi:hypothetical protein